MDALLNVIEAASSALSDGPLYRFADWPPSTVPNGPAGVYAVWHSSAFLYAGMSWRHVNTDEQIGSTPRGVLGRLASHASGRRSGDQFNVYICDRFVIPELTADDLTALRQGERLLDNRTRSFVRDFLSFRVWIAPDGPTARVVESTIRRDGLAKWGQPLINPQLGSAPKFASA